MWKKFTVLSMAMSAFIWTLPLCGAPQAEKKGKCHKHHSHKHSHHRCRCDSVHVIDHVPYTITKSGKYCVKKDLVFDDVGAAITVNASNVTINFHNHSLTLINQSAVGVLASGIRELSIENDIIQTPVFSTSKTSAAIQLVECEKVTLDNIFTLNTFFGVLIQNSEDVFITHSEFRDHIGGTGAGSLNTSFGINATASNNVVVEESSFFGTNPNESTTSASGPIFYNEGCINCRVSKCQFTNVDVLIAGQIDGLIVEDSSFAGAANAVFAKIQLGRGAVGSEANDVIIRNCTFLTNSTASGETLIFHVRGDGLLVENCILDQSGNPGGNPIGVGPFGNNTTIRNCIIQASTEDIAIAIDIFGGIHGTVIDNCQLTGGGPLGVNIAVEDVFDTVIKNCEISGSTTNGIEILDPAQNTTLINNTSRDNGGSGFFIHPGASITRLEYNKALANGADGIHNESDSTQTYFNTSCGNGLTSGIDCTGVFPAQSPGDSPAVAGSNVCCSTSSAKAAKAKQPVGSKMAAKRNQNTVQ